MLRISGLALTAALLSPLVLAPLATPAAAQPTASSAAPRAAAPARHHRRPAMHSRMMRGGNANDRGPFTPEANRAYQGGGMVVETPMPAGRM